MYRIKFALSFEHECYKEHSLIQMFVILDHLMNTIIMIFIFENSLSTIMIVKRATFAAQFFWKNLFRNLFKQRVIRTMENDTISDSFVQKWTNDVICL